MFRFNATPEEMSVFLDELEEQLQVLEENIIKLEKEGNLKYLAEIFRIAHTIKGSSASIGYQEMTNLTHIMENILDKLNQRKLLLGPEIIESLFNSLDALKLLKKSIETGKEVEFDLESLIQRFEEMGGERKTSASMAKSQVNYLDMLKDLEKNSINLLAQKYHLFDVAITFHPDCDLPIVRAFQASIELEKYAQILFSLPPIEDLKKGDAVFSVFKVFLATITSKSKLEGVLKGNFEIKEITIAQVSSQNLTGYLENLSKPSLTASDVLAVKKTEGSDIVISKTTTSESITPDIKKATRSIRVSVDILDSLMNLVGELVIDRTRLVQLGTTMESTMQGSHITTDLMDTAIHISKTTNELQEQIMKARMVSIDMIFSKFPRMVRDISHKAGKDVNFVVEGGDTELDKAIIEEISDPLIHLLRNSLDHGIEPPDERKLVGKNPRGLIYLGAYHEENHIIITVRDDGRGINIERIREKAIQKGLVGTDQAKEMSERELLELIFVPGFTTTETVSDMSGRGVGMDIVKNNLQKIGGTIDVMTELGKGTTFTIRIPLTLAIMQALLVTAKNIVFAVPLGSIVEIVKIPKNEVQTVSGYEVFNLRGEVVPLAPLVELFNETMDRGSPELNIVVVSYGDKQVGMIADTLMGKQEVVIKTMGQYIGDLPGLSGVTILGDGAIGLILDVISFINSVIQSRRSQARKVS